MNASSFTRLEDVVLADEFPDLDLALRRGQHIDRDSGTLYSFLIDAQPYLETFYRRYGCELIHSTDGFFYLLPTGDRLGRRHLSPGEMLVGQALTLLYLDPATVQHTPHEPVRIVSLDSGYELEVLVGGRWTALYRFTLDEQFLADYELASWYLATHPESRFVQSLMAARPDDDRRYSLQNTTLTTHPLEGGAADRRQLADVDELLGVLRETFLLEVVATPEVVRGLERLFRPG